MDNNMLACNVAYTSWCVNKLDCMLRFIALKPALLEETSNETLDPQPSPYIYDALASKVLFCCTVLKAIRFIIKSNLANDTPRFLTK